MVELFIVYTCILIFLNLYLIFGWNKKFFARRIDKNQGMLPSIKNNETNGWRHGFPISVYKKIIEGIHWIQLVEK